MKAKTIKLIAVSSLLLMFSCKSEQGSNATSERGLAHAEREITLCEPYEVDDIFSEKREVEEKLSKVKGPAKKLAIKIGNYNYEQAYEYCKSDEMSKKDQFECGLFNQLYKQVLPLEEELAAIDKKYKACVPDKCIIDYNDDGIISLADEDDYKLGLKYSHLRAKNKYYKYNELLSDSWDYSAMKRKITKRTSSMFHKCDKTKVFLPYIVDGVVRHKAAPKSRNSYFAHGQKFVEGVITHVSLNDRKYIDSIRSGKAIMESMHIIKKQDGSFEKYKSSTSLNTFRRYCNNTTMTSDLFWDRFTGTYRNDSEFFESLNLPPFRIVDRFIDYRIKENHGVLEISAECFVHKPTDVE